jgi:hypothetical protein
MSRRLTGGSHGRVTWPRGSARASRSGEGGGALAGFPARVDRSTEALALGGSRLSPWPSEMASIL